MTLPPKCLHVLANLKSELIQKQTEIMEPMEGEKFAFRGDKNPQPRMRHARVKGGAWQRYRRSQLSR